MGKTIYLEEDVWRMLTHVKTESGLKTYNEVIMLLLKRGGLTYQADSLIKKLMGGK